MRSYRNRHDRDDPRVIACQRAIQKAGGYTKLAQALGIKPQAVYYWEIVPSERCLQVSQITGISVHELRPEVFGKKPEPKRAVGA
jgi:DNA-binding transcriptional regulator YdaS (Cro superfamily)